MLSNSILNKFAPGHAVFRQQLEMMKDKQVDFLEEQRNKENLEKKMMLRRMHKGYEGPQNLNELQRKMAEKKQQREKLYANNPEMLVGFLLPKFL